MSGGVRRVGSFFERNRRQLLARGIDPSRLPPGQYSTERFPVLHAGPTPVYRDLSAWTLTVDGAVRNELTLSWSEVLELPAVEITVDIHCVTKWSRFDTTWRGVALDTVLESAGVEPTASYLMAHGEYGFTANLPLDEIRGLDEEGRPLAILAYEHGGKPLDPDHGYPLRLVVPHLYFWKSAKWLRGLELMTENRPGFWEQNGYHDHGDPWAEERYG